jgi:nucleoside-diphosphate kinase
VRKTLGLSVGENSVHGSDGPDTATQEIAQFFTPEEIVG